MFSLPRWCARGADPSSAPRIGAVRDRVQLTLLEPVEPEGLQQVLLFAQNLIGNQMPHADHLPAVVAVSDNRRVLVEMIENRETVRCEAPNTTGCLAVLFGHRVLIALLAMGQSTDPHMRKFRR